MVDLRDKIQCVSMVKSGKSKREVYEEYYKTRYPNSSFDTFRKNIANWMNKSLGDADTLHAGTYPGFRPHAATVQVNKNGEISQAWVKQLVSDVQFEELVETIKSNTEVHRWEIKKNNEESSGMLEIPLYDMHFPLNDYLGTLSSILEIIKRKRWESINLVIGQDMFHNDDFRGRTSSGRPIEKVDIKEAWEMSKEFWYNIIMTSIESSDSVHLIYSKGNHDESLAWAFVQMLKVAFPKLIVDDSLKPRKAIFWKNCFIGISHGCEKKSANEDLRGQFTVEYPREFAFATVREIHVGHLHHEREADMYGVMIRRLSSGVPTDEWSENQGYVGSHKRFMIFEWLPGRLKSLHYV